MPPESARHRSCFIQRQPGQAVPVRQMLSRGASDPLRVARKKAGMLLRMRLASTEPGEDQARAFGNQWMLPPIRHRGDIRALFRADADDSFTPRMLASKQHHGSDGSCALFRHDELAGPSRRLWSDPDGSG